MMYAIQLDMYQAAAVAALVLLLGRFLVRNLDLLRRYCIPEPVAGGVCFCPDLALRQAGILEISFDSTLLESRAVFFLQRGLYGLLPPSEKGGLQVPPVLRDRRYDVCAPERPGRLHCQRLWSGPPAGTGHRLHPRWRPRDCGLLRPAPGSLLDSGSVRLPSLPPPSGWWPAV